MKKVTFILILIFSFLIGTSQSCLPEGITFETQAQIDSFQVDYPGCVDIEGDVSIGIWYYNDDIKNLHGLSVLRTVGGDLNISINDSLMSLQGLEQLTLVTGNLHIFWNPSLTMLGGLDNLIYVGGHLNVDYNDGLTSLSGLENLTYVGGGLYISYNDGLVSLTGLENALLAEDIRLTGNDALINLSDLINLTSVGGDLAICGNENIPDLTGLDNLTSIEGSLLIGTYGIDATPGNVVDCWGNPSLTNISALSNLQTVGGDIGIYCNDLLSDLSGLSNVDSIGGSLDIGYALDNDPGNTAGNSSLTDLTGLESLSVIEGNLFINGNNSLTSLTGIDNIVATSIDNIDISFNSSLSGCEVQSICDYLAAPNGETTIQVNASGCNNPAEVANACGFQMPCLPFGNYYFYSQSDIDNFSTNYPGCTVLEGTVLIHGEDITNLNGLSEVTAFGRTLEIAGNDSLGSLTGLNNVTSVGGDLIIGDPNYGWPGWGGGGNQILTNMSGLNNLDSIGHSLKIIYNESLINLAGLENLTSISHLTIWGNGLIGLTGLDHIEANSIEDLTITYNPDLSHCSVLSICNYLRSPNGYVTIENNFTGCNSPEEVQDSCEAHGVNIDEHIMRDEVILYPNPATNKVNISTGDGREIDEVSIYTLTGQQVLKARPVNGKVDISHLQPGMYIVEVVVENIRLRQKLLIE